MSETGGLDIGAPQEDGGQASEGLSEEARARFTAAAAAGQQTKKDEKKAKKRDDGVAQMILKFLTDEQRTHLATLISRLVARDCPSPFLLAVLSLINAECRTVVRDYLADKGIAEDQALESQRGIVAPGQLDVERNREMADWLARMELVLQTDPTEILRSLLLDQGNLDGTILQLVTFVLQEFLQKNGQNADFEKLQVLSASILQSLFTPYMHLAPLPEAEVKPEE
jgi:hypothetical protein